jgi:hypothetical protein
MEAIPESLRLTHEEHFELSNIRRLAKVRHNKARLAVAAKGRHNFPYLPFECSWAFKEQFRRNIRQGMKYDVRTKEWSE